jgi:hypothetical protein
MTGTCSENGPMERSFTLEMTCWICKEEIPDDDSFMVHLEAGKWCASHEYCWMRVGFETLLGNPEAE